jgi:hypothetical protein
MISVIKSLVLVVFTGLLGINLTLTPVFAAGPLNSDGHIDPTQALWINATPGKNPMTADEAAAAMVLFNKSKIICRDKMSKNDVVSFFDDILAGGNALEDFEADGKYHGKMYNYQVFLELAFSDENIALTCTNNPYITQ